MDFLASSIMVYLGCHLMSPCAAVTAFSMVLGSAAGQLLTEVAIALTPIIGGIVLKARSQLRVVMPRSSNVYSASLVMALGLAVSVGRRIVVWRWEYWRCEW
jgi:hypothetical protein